MLVLKDFTSIVDMHRDARAEVLAALREVFDGRWDRNVGAEGGRTWTWTGHLGLLAGCTTASDSAHGVISVNRIARLHFLRMQNSIPAHLVFVYFLNATEVNGPWQQAEYEGGTKVIEHYLGIRRTKLSRYIHKLYVDVRDLPRPEPLSQQFL